MIEIKSIFSSNHKASALVPNLKVRYLNINIEIHNADAFKCKVVAELGFLLSNALRLSKVMLIYLNFKV